MGSIGPFHEGVFEVEVIVIGIKMLLHVVVAGSDWRGNPLFLDTSTVGGGGGLGPAPPVHTRELKRAQSRHDRKCVGYLIVERLEEGNRAEFSAREFHGENNATTHGVRRLPEGTGRYHLQ